jgi:hypothetical protein
MIFIAFILFYEIISLISCDIVVTSHPQWGESGGVVYTIKTSHMKQILSEQEQKLTSNTDVVIKLIKNLVCLKMN